MDKPVNGKRTDRSGKRVKPAGQTKQAPEWLRRGGKIGRFLFFPLTFLYIELIFHLYMGMSMHYFPIWALSSLAAGALMTALTTPFSEKVNRVVAKVISIAVTLLYIIEIVAKKILTNYYPFSALGMAADNHLTDYLDVIVSTVVKTIPIMLVLLLPTIALFVVGKWARLFQRTRVQFTAAVAVAAILLHLLGLGALHLPWSGDLNPAQLYKTDTNLDDQVEQLGLLTMLRMDLVHQVIPPDDLLGELGEIPTPVPSPSPSQTPADPTETPPPVESGEPAPSPTPTLDISPNVMDVDLTAIAESTDNKNIKWLAQYFNSKTPTNKNEYTGMFEGYNVIFLTLEGFSGYAIDEELTPTLYKLTHEGFVFENYYTALHFTSTSGGECQNLLGLYPKNGNPATMNRTGALGNNCYFSLAQQLGRLGYTNLGYHANGDMYKRLRSHTNLGYDWRQSGSGFELETNSSGKSRWPQRDQYLIEASVDDYLGGDTPFNIYYLTISGHMPYSKHWIVNKYWDLVKDLPYSDTTKNYMATCIEVDRAFEALLAKLKEAGKLDKTLIVASADHIPYFNVDVLEELAGKKFGPMGELEMLNESHMDVDVYRNSLIIWSASMEEPVQVDKVCCQVDILPTVSNLLGLEYDSRMLSGTDLLSDSEGQVIFTSRSWITDRGYYNRFSQKFTPAEGVEMTEEETKEYVSAVKKQVSNKLGCTDLIVENDFYDYVFGQ